MKSIELYVAGSATGNNLGPGGFGAILVYGKHRKEFSRGLDRTLTTRMELHGVLEGFSALNQPCEVTV